MKKTLFLLLSGCAALLAGVANCAHGAERGTEEQARAMVERTLAAFASSGVEATLTAINKPGSAFQKNDLFVFVYDYEGGLLALATREKIGPKRIIAMSDLDGAPLADGLVRMVRRDKRGWYGPYRFADTRGPTFEYKKAYCEQAGVGLLACVGVYLGDQKN